jgi:hypothetical protein
MKHALYEHPITHKFALIRLPRRFADGDAVATSPSDRWFSDREQAIAALPGLFDEDDSWASDEPDAQTASREPRREPQG